VREHAAARVRADLALRSVVAQEAISATDEELDTEIARLAEQVGEKAAKVHKDLERRGALEAVRSDIARGKALALLVERAAVVDEAGNTIDLTVPAEAGPDVASESEEEPEA
jgi:trigger factor